MYDVVGAKRRFCFFELDRQLCLRLRTLILLQLLKALTTSPLTSGVLASALKAIEVVEQAPGVVSANAKVYTFLSPRCTFWLLHP